MKDSGRLTRKQAAEALGVTTKTLALWERSGKIPAPERDWRGWRWYDPETLVEIRRKMLGGDEKTQPPLEIPGMELSTRNRLRGIVKEITCDDVQCEVVVELPDKQEIVSVITHNSVRRLRLRVGDKVTVVFKETDVMLAR
ncbi:MAG TPA: TOBE domain-containing protein [Fimbriimonadales bacterium]|nr:TOBE domain-containing protein [Fimbriimonadales bacterium]